MKQRVKRCLFVIFSIALLSIGLSGCSSDSTAGASPSFDDVRAENYKQACDLYDEGNYSSAAGAFEKLIGYEDAESKYKESSYLAARDYIDSCNYEDALTYLDKAKDYRDTEKLIEYCNIMLNYAYAEEYYEVSDYQQAFESLLQMPDCKEKSDFLNILIQEASVDLTQLEADFDNNTVRAEAEYENKFFFIEGTVQGTDSTLVEGKKYLKVKVGSCSHYAHCYGLTTSELSSLNKDDYVCLAGVFDANYGWWGIDFEACRLITDNELFSNKPLKVIYGLSEQKQNTHMSSTASENAIESSSNLPIVDREVDLTEFMGNYEMAVADIDCSDHTLDIIYDDFTLTLTCYDYRLKLFDHIMVLAEDIWPIYTGNSFSFLLGDNIDSDYPGSQYTLTYVPQEYSSHGCDTILMKMEYAGWVDERVYLRSDDSVIYIPPTTGTDGDYYENDDTSSWDYYSSDNVYNSTDWYLFPSDSEYITHEFLIQCSQEEVSLIRNEIYARYGYNFNDQKLKDYFESQEWYTPVSGLDASTFDSSILNQYERENLDAIIQYEREQEWRK